MLATASDDGTIMVWDVASGKATASLKEIDEVTGRQWKTWRVLLGPDGKTLAAAGSNDGITIWDVAKRKIISCIDGTLTAKCLAFSPDGKMLAYRSSPTTVGLWDLIANKKTATFQVEEEPFFTAIAFSLDGKTLAYGTLRERMKVWQWRLVKNGRNRSPAHLGR